VIIGPEGGLTPAEAALATTGGFLPVTLGKRILRTETAGPAVLAILQYVWGDMG
jgi:16S rRNA (uracil1498-N3)-methyltransferase